MTPAQGVVAGSSLAGSSFGSPPRPDALGRYEEPIYLDLGWAVPRLWERAAVDT